MRIIDWSSDVCSSDLAVLAQRGVDAGDLHAQLRGADGGVVAGGAGADDDDVELLLFAHCVVLVPGTLLFKGRARVGMGCLAAPVGKPIPIPAFPLKGKGKVTSRAASGADSRAGS